MPTLGESKQIAEAKVIADKRAAELAAQQAAEAKTANKAHLPFAIHINAGELAAVSPGGIRHGGLRGDQPGAGADRLDLAVERLAVRLGQIAPFGLALRRRVRQRRERVSLVALGRRSGGQLRSAPVVVCEKQTSRV